MGGRVTHFQEEFDGPRDLCQATGNELTDDALLEIFDFYLNNNDPDRIQSLNEWHTLAHVCRRWRDLVFESPRRLHLRLLCRIHTPVRAMLDIWPALPIHIQDNWAIAQDVGPDSIIAALAHSNRVCAIHLYEIPSSVGDALAAAIMQVSFPELTHLDIQSSNEFAPVIPDSFLGASAPRLRTLGLRGISFPALPNLLLSANGLVNLFLWPLPHSGYISPRSMVACLSSLNRLQLLELGFQSPRSRPDQPSPPPQTRVVLPALTELTFHGMVDYSEDFLARIDTPVLNNFSMSFFLDLVFDISHLKQFIGRAKYLEPPKVARAVFNTCFIRLEFNRRSMLEVRCDRIDWQVDSMTLICGCLSPFFSHINRLDLVADSSLSEPQGINDSDFEPIQFLELFQPFITIRSLHVSSGLAALIAAALQELVGERATEVLPNLTQLFWEAGSRITVMKAIQPFVTARLSSGLPVAVHLPKGSRDSVRGSIPRGKESRDSVRRPERSRDSVHRQCRICLFSTSPEVWEYFNGFCSDAHMWQAINNRLALLCPHCRLWACRVGDAFCGGPACRQY